MLNVSNIKVNNITNTKTQNSYEQKINSFGNNTDARQIYFDMNKSVYEDYVDGDISLAKMLSNKLKNFWKHMI